MKHLLIEPPGDEEVLVRLGAADAQRTASILLDLCGPVPPDEHDLYRIITALETAAWHGESR